MVNRCRGILGNGNEVLEIANQVLMLAQNDHMKSDEYPNIVLKCYDEKIWQRLIV